MAERWMALGSREGTTIRAGIGSVINSELHGINPVCVLSSSRSAGVNRVAQDLLVPLRVVDREDYRSEDGKINYAEYNYVLSKTLREYDPTLVTLNGWMHIVPENVIKEYKGRIFNQHPGSAPEFGGKGMYGIRVHAARLNFMYAVGRDFWTEAVIQRADKEVDEGAVVKSKRIEIFPEDTPESLQERVLPVEHKLFVEFLKDFVRGEIREEKRESLVLSGEEHILFKAKQDAIKAYPKI